MEVDKVADMVVDHVADMVTNMKVDMVVDDVHTNGYFRTFSHKENFAMRGFGLVFLLPVWQLTTGLKEIKSSPKIFSSKSFFCAA